jgi:hypothetical protein
LGGALNIALVDAFAPAVGQTFPLLSGAITSLTGAFDAINLPNFDGHNTFQLTYGGASEQLSAIPGADFNNDGAVNGLDLAQWRAGFGQVAAATHAQGDADGDFDVDGADFLVWQRQIGTPAASTVARAVPEPRTFSMVVAALGLAVARRRHPARSPQPLAA